MGDQAQAGAAMWCQSYSTEWKEGCIDPIGAVGGKLLEDKWRGYCRFWGQGGVYAVRVLPYLLKDDFDGRGPHIGTFVNALPFAWYGGKFRLSELNPAYFAHRRRMAEIANEEGLVFTCTIFDRCHGMAPTGPWFNNEEGIRGWYGLPDQAKAYTQRMEQAMQGLKVEFEVENEPFDHRFEQVYDWCFKYLHDARGYARSQIITGCEFYYKDPNNFKKWIDDGPLTNRPHRLEQKSVMHNMGQEQLDWWDEKFSGTPAKEKGRGAFMSDDGIAFKRTREENKAFYLPFLKKHPNAHALAYRLESCIAPSRGDNRSIDELLDAPLGIVDAIRESLGAPPIEVPDPPKPPVDPPVPPVDPPVPPVDPPVPPVDPPVVPEEKEGDMPDVDFKSMGVHLWGFLKATGIFLYQVARWMAWGAGWIFKKIKGKKG